MGYVFILLTLFFGAAKGFCGKKTSNEITRFSDAITFSMMRMLLCIPVGIIAVLIENNGRFGIGKAELLIALVSGIASAVNILTWIISVHTGSYMMVDVFLTAGLAVPILFSAVLFGETVSAAQMIGFVLLLLTTVIMTSYNNGIKSKVTLFSLILLILCGLMSGVADFSQKLYVMVSDGGSASVFNFYVYIFTAMVFVLCFGILKAKDRKAGSIPKKKIKKIFPYLTVMALSLFLYAFFKTRAAEFLPAAVIYPVCQVSSTLISACMSVFLFKEKMTSRGLAGIGTAIAALVFLNV